MRQEDGPPDNMKEELINSGLSWLFEMEFLESQSAQDALALNLYSCSRAIDDIEILIDKNTKSMLIWVRMKWWGKLLFRKKVIQERVSELVKQVLPSFLFRVVFEKWIFDLALQKQQARALGGKDEGDKKSDNSDGSPTDESSSGSEAAQSD